MSEEKKKPVRMTNYKEKLKHITTFVFDYDGVLTDSTILLLDGNEPMRTANVKDGYAIQLAVKKGYRLAVISGGKSGSMLFRMHALGVKDTFLGVQNKLKVLHKYKEDNNISSNEILFMGDDIPDYELMLEAGLPTCPADAVQEIKAVAAYISHFDGGRGCVRDVIEQVLKIQGNWFDGEAFDW